jgi:hypothetical protein
MPSIRQRLKRWRKDIDTKATILRGAGQTTPQNLELASSAQIPFPASNSIGIQKDVDDIAGDRLADDDLNPLGESLDDWAESCSILNPGDVADFSV